MKMRQFLKGLFFTIVILLLLAAIALGGYMYYRTLQKRDITPDEILQIEQEKTQVAYEENLTYALANRDKYDFVVVLNPAHGGMDSGNSSEYGLEKNITLAICEQVIRTNTDASLGIFLTRDDDVGMEEAMRLSFIEEISPDMYIDIHVSKDTITNSYGTVTYYDSTYYNGKLTNVELADIMERSIVTAIEGFAGGVFEADKEETGIIATLQMPAVSVTCGDLSNEMEGTLLTREPYQKNMAKGIIEGITTAREKLQK